ncbi:hypothetical protein BH10ACT4_BH10ACT4_13690 [soil metagenome]
MGEKPVIEFEFAVAVVENTHGIPSQSVATGVFLLLAE